MKNYENNVIGTFLNQKGLHFVELLSEDDFSFNKLVFKNIAKTVNSTEKEMDIIAIAKNSGYTIEQLMELRNKAIPEMIESNVKALRKNTASNKFNTIISSKYDGDVNDNIEKVITSLQGITVTNNKVNDINGVISNYKKLLEERRINKGNELYIDLARFNQVTAGFHKKEMTIIAARPAVGKTAFGTQIADVLATKNHKALLISVEMADTGIMERMVMKYSGVSNNKLRTIDLDESDLEKIDMAYETIAKKNLIIETSVRTVGEVRAAVVNYNPEIVIIDYVGLLKDTSQKFNTRWEEIGSISRKLKLIAMDFNIPVVVLAQLGRATKGQEHIIPKLSDLADSGSLERDADNVIFLHELDAENAVKWDFGSEDECKTMVEMRQKPILLMIEKQRNGEPKYIKTALSPNTLSLIEVGKLL